MISKWSIIFLLFALTIVRSRKLWNKERKSAEEINSAYYCVKEDVYRYNWDNKRLFPALLKVIQYNTLGFL